MLKFDYKPTFDWVLIKQTDIETKTKSGIIILNTTKTFKEQPFKGNIIKCGPLVQDVAENDVILWNKDSHKEVMLDGEKYFMVKEPDILGVW